ncbi:cytidine deaminase [Clostridium lundense]|uniref:cytidine deaminase n=1 Tax=Clostridium lundense TaxID=319475 RepID=UPI0004897CF6|nr:cytidine deaminase [Clostridium lundense]
MNIEQEMYTRAIEFIEQRYPTGWGGAAVIHTDDNRYLISVALESFNASVVVCIETGAMCEAQKYNAKVTHCLCVVRDDENSPFKVLSPCGVCQERLRYWGEDVKVGVTTKDNTLKFVTLKELQPESVKVFL